MDYKIGPRGSVSRYLIMIREDIQKYDELPESVKDNPTDDRTAQDIRWGLGELLIYVNNPYVRGLLDEDALKDVERAVEIRDKLTLMDKRDVMQIIDHDMRDMWPGLGPFMDAPMRKDYEHSHHLCEDKPAEE